jgi:hypothetical protein
LEGSLAAFALRGALEALAGFLVLVVLAMDGGG